MDPITPDDVADFLGTPVDDRMTRATDAAVAWVTKRRCNTAPADLWPDADVRQGTVMYAGLLYTSRAQPQGFPGMSDLGTYSEDTGQAMVQIYRLVGADPVVA